MSEMDHEHEFEILEHTADIGIVGRGRDMAEAFENTAYGVFSVMADIGKYEPTGQKSIVAIGDDDVELLGRFLSSLLVLFDSEGVLPLDFEITEISMGRLTCWVSVRKIDDSIEWLGPQVKAVTYHQMSVEGKGGHWTAQAILDV